MITIKTLTKKLMEKYIDEIVKIEDDCFFHDDNFSDERWLAENYIAEYDGKWKLSQIAFNENEEVVGAYVVTTIGDYCHANRLIVSSKFRRCGVGNRLMDALIDATKKEGLLGLINFVHYDNKKSLCLLEKTGWTLCKGEQLRYFAKLKGREVDGFDYVLTSNGNKMVMLFNDLTKQK